MSKHPNDQRPFEFRQFSLYHHQSTMKVGIDAILLGIWTQLSLSDEVLDIGVGSGVISLLLASRGVKSITAIDIDKSSVDEASLNFAKSPWTSQLNAKHQSLQSFAHDQQATFDLVVSNPPFFIQGVLSSSERLSNARHTRSLSYSELIENASKLLNKTGIFSVVLPYDNANIFVTLCKQNNLFLKRKMLIFPRRGTSPNRMNMEFSFQREVDTQVEMLSIREDNNEYSDEFIQITKNYYL